MGQHQMPYQPAHDAAGGGRRPSPSHRNTSPWHQPQEDPMQQRRTPTRREPPPFGVDAPVVGSSARSGSRSRVPLDPYNAPAAGNPSVMGRAGRTPGGASQIVFG